MEANAHCRPLLRGAQPAEGAGPRSSEGKPAPGRQTERKYLAGGARGWAGGLWAAQPLSCWTRRGEPPFLLRNSLRGRLCDPNPSLETPTLRSSSLRPVQGSQTARPASPRGKRFSLLQSLTGSVPPAPGAHQNPKPHREKPEASASSRGQDTGKAPLRGGGAAARGILNRAGMGTGTRVGWG